MIIELATVGACVSIANNVFAIHDDHKKRRKPKKKLSAKKAGSSRSAKPSDALLQVRTIASELWTAVNSRERESQIAALGAGQKIELNKLQRNTKRNMLMATGAMGLALAGNAVPALSLVAAGIVVWLARPAFMRAINAIRQKQLSSYLIDIVIILGVMAIGQVFLAALIAFFSNFASQIVKSTEATSRLQLNRVFGHQVSRVWIEKDGQEIEVPLDQLTPGSIVLVNAGEILPVDGEIETGIGTVDQHMLTGESEPVEKAPGDQVFASTHLLTGRLRIRVDKSGSASLAAEITEILNNTTDYAQTLSSRGQQISDSYVPMQLALSAMAWPLIGPAAALSVLYVPLGTDIRMTGPLTVLNFLHVFARQGVLIKDGVILEQLHKVDTVVFDKTGTLTQEQPTAGAIHCCKGFEADTVLAAASTAEQRQPHPIARAIIERAKASMIEPWPVDEAAYATGFGIKVIADGRTITVGSAKFFKREGIALELADLGEVERSAHERGFSLVYVGIDGTLAGVIEIEPTVRPEAAEIVAALQEQGKDVVIISGDHERATSYLARKLGIKKYYAGTLPQGKAEIVQDLRDKGRFVAFVGDGINDSIALKTAQVSISLRGATTIATDTAQIVMMHGHLEPLPGLFDITEDFELTMNRNIYYSVVPNMLGIFGVYFLHFTLLLNIGLRYFGMVGGLQSSMKPLVRYRDEDQPAITSKPAITPRNGKAAPNQSEKPPIH